ncbi:hypothetical protein HWI79_3742 [Cryptosporidium felis]|nr:hypothetical protein HWI79_3742 [Cryptosporidium felis]
MKFINILILILSSLTFNIYVTATSKNDRTKTQLRSQEPDNNGPTSPYQSQLTFPLPFGIPFFNFIPSQPDGSQFNYFFRPFSISMNKLLIVAIQGSSKIRKLPFLGTFSEIIDCKEVKGIGSYDLYSKKFIHTRISCRGSLNIQNFQGKLSISTVQNKDKPNEQSSLSFGSRSCNIKRLPRYMKYLSHFRHEIFHPNFSLIDDQSFPEPQSIPHYLGYISNTQKEIPNPEFEGKNGTIHLPNSTEFGYNVFNTTQLVYAVPLFKGCQASIHTENATISHVCPDINYNYDVKTGIFEYQNIQILTTNINGVFVITSNDTEILYTKITETLQHIQGTISEETNGNLNSNN